MKTFLYNLAGGLNTIATTLDRLTELSIQFLGWSPWRNIVLFIINLIVFYGGFIGTMVCIAEHTPKLMFLLPWLVFVCIFTLLCMLNQAFRPKISRP